MVAAVHPAVESVGDTHCFSTGNSDLNVVAMAVVLVCGDGKYSDDYAADVVVSVRMLAMLMGCWLWWEFGDIECGLRLNLVMEKLVCANSN